MYVVHRPGGERLSLLGVETTDLRASQVPEFTVPERGLEVIVDYALVAYVGAVRQLSGVNERLEAIGEPRVKPLLDLHLAVEDEALIRVGAGLVQFLLDLSVLPPVDRGSPRPLRGVDGVPGHIEPVLSLRYPVAFGGHLYSSPSSTDSISPTHSSPSRCLVSLSRSATATISGHHRPRLRIAVSHANR